MSFTTTPPPTLSSTPQSSDYTTSLRNSAIAVAKDVPSLIAGLQQVDPDMAAALTPKAMIGSKTVWAPLVTWLVTAGASRYGIGWDDATCATVASLISYGVVLACRAVTKSPIGGVLSVAPVKS